MFLPSQLVEIAQRFRADVEDLQVLLQEEGLPVGSTDCLEILFTRLNSDARFRRDLAFLVRSMLHREPEEPGSMDVLGVLVVAAAGTRPELDKVPQQNLLRELLRFVMQQRRRDTTPAALPAESEAGAVLRDAIAAAVVDGQAPLVPAARVAAPAPAEVQTAPDYDYAPLLTQIEPEPFWRRLVPVVPIVLLALLIGLGAGLVLRRGSSGAVTPSETSITVAPLSPSPVIRQERPSAAAASPQSKHTSRKPLLVVPRVISRRAQPPQVSAPAGMAANTPPNAVESHPPPQINPPPQTGNQPAQASTQTAQPLNGNPAPPVLQRRNPAATTLPASPPRQPSAPTSVGNVFAHPEADASTAGQPPPAVFSRPKDPVLIARNSPAAAVPAKPQIQGTVHLGSTGNMASNLMYSPEPEYPAVAIAAGVEGEVKIRAVVGPHGDVIDESVVSGPPLLRDAALEAVGRWRYRPYEQDGKPVAVATTAILDFQIPPMK